MARFFFITSFFCPEKRSFAYAQDDLNAAGKPDMIKVTNFKCWEPFPLPNHLSGV